VGIAYAELPGGPPVWGTPPKRRAPAARTVERPPDVPARTSDTHTVAALLAAGMPAALIYGPMQPPNHPAVCRRVGVIGRHGLWTDLWSKHGATACMAWNAAWWP